MLAPVPSMITLLLWQLTQAQRKNIQIKLSQLLTQTQRNLQMICSTCSWLSTQVDVQGRWRWCEARWMEAACSERPISANMVWIYHPVFKMHPNPSPRFQFRSVWNMWWQTVMMRYTSRTPTCGKHWMQTRTPSQTSGKFPLGWFTKKADKSAKKQWLFPCNLWIILG